MLDYNAIASDYARYRQAHPVVLRELITTPALCANSRVLEVGCGTGTLTLAAKRQAGPSGKVFGIDIIPGMIEVCQRKAAQANADITFQLGSMDDIPFSVNQFDVVMCSFMIFHMSENMRRKGFAEIYRVLKPQGRLLVLDFGKPDNALWRGLYFSYLKAFVPCLGKVFCGDASAYAYILESLRHYPAQQGVEARMREHGLVQVRTLNLLGGAMSINFGEK